MSTDFQNHQEHFREASRNLVGDFLLVGLWFIWNGCAPLAVPLLWATSPRDLLVPRAIAQADGLTIAK